METFQNTFVMIFWTLFGIYFAYKLYRSIRIVSAQDCIVVERLGKYSRTLHAGLHLLWPFLEKDAYYHTLKEQATDVPPQTCITKDNVKVEMDGILYLKVLDPYKASYGINDYQFAASQLAQTTMRAIIGTMDLDVTFETRDAINSKILEVLDLAAESWGIKVNRYEIVNITPPKSILEAMEKEKKRRSQKRRRSLFRKGIGTRESTDLSVLKKKPSTSLKAKNKKESTKPKESLKKWKPLQLQPQKGSNYSLSRSTQKVDRTQLNSESVKNLSKNLRRFPTKKRKSFYLSI
ncbi:SPFH domain/Band 7 family protein [Leptospira borgpetersenii str. 200701203]|uniref:SPFH domain/Band 7 family protein n=1 Tax=Leptospira borgpetersenii str. 200701203 TaxID=1193007 RepID=M3HMB9_LEPBO|nr:SPFH domain/Band 7 family protein [Leptospira borgpetersenii str. 200701203]